jgi:hypothetical protein
MQKLKQQIRDVLNQHMGGVVVSVLLLVLGVDIINVTAGLIVAILYAVIVFWANFPKIDF